MKKTISFLLVFLAFGLIGCRNQNANSSSSVNSAISFTDLSEQILSIDPSKIDILDDEKVGVSNLSSLTAPEDILNRLSEIFKDIEATQVTSELIDDYIDLSLDDLYNIRFFKNGISELSSFISFDLGEERLIYKVDDTVYDEISSLLIDITSEIFHKETFSADETLVLNSEQAAINLNTFGGTSAFETDNHIIMISPTAETNAVEIFDRSSGDSVFYKEISSIGLSGNSFNSTTNTLRVNLSNYSILSITADFDVSESILTMPEEFIKTNDEANYQSNIFFDGTPDASEQNNRWWATCDNTGIHIYPTNGNPQGYIFIENTKIKIETYPSAYFGNIRFLNDGKVLTAEIIVPSTQSATFGLYTLDLKTMSEHFYLNIFSVSPISYKVDDRYLYIQGHAQTFIFDAAEGVISFSAHPDTDNFIYSYDNSQYFYQDFNSDNSVIYSSNYQDPIIELPEDSLKLLAVTRDSLICQTEISGNKEIVAYKRPADDEIIPFSWNSDL